MNPVALVASVGSAAVAVAAVFADPVEALIVAGVTFVGLVATSASERDL